MFQHKLSGVGKINLLIEIHLFRFFTVPNLLWNKIIKPLVNFQKHESKTINFVNVLSIKYEVNVSEWELPTLYLIAALIMKWFVLFFIQVTFHNFLYYRPFLLLSLSLESVTCSFYKFIHVFRLDFIQGHSCFLKSLVILNSSLSVIMT